MSPSAIEEACALALTILARTDEAPGPEEMELAIKGALAAPGCIASVAAKLLPTPAATP